MFNSLCSHSNYPLVTVFDYSNSYETCYVTATRHYTLMLPNENQLKRHIPCLAAKGLNSHRTKLLGLRHVIYRCDCHGDRRTGIGTFC